MSARLRRQANATLARAATTDQRTMFKHPNVPRPYRTTIAAAEIVSVTGPSSNPTSRRLFPAWRKSIPGGWFCRRIRVVSISRVLVVRTGLLNRQFPRLRAAPLAFSSSLTCSRWAVVSVGFCFRVRSSVRALGIPASWATPRDFHGSLPLWKLSVPRHCLRGMLGFPLGLTLR